MRRTRIAAITAAGAIVAAGGGVAFATTSSDDPREREQAVLEDAAAQLDVAPSDLRDALADAQDDQLDADVQAGRISQEQADALKERRREAGVVLGGGPPFFAGKAFAAPAGPHEALRAAAKALGIGEKALFRRLEDGESLGEIAEAEGKRLDDVKAAVRAAVKPALDKAVEQGPLTREQADRMLDRIVEHLGEGPIAMRFHRKGGPDEIALHVDGPDHLEFDADGPPPLPVP
jgi:hypothetical protein